MLETQSRGHTGSVAHDELNIAQLWGTLRRNRWLVAGITATLMLLAALLTWQQRPIYQSTLTLAIENDPGVTNPFGNVLPMAGTVVGQLETEIVVLRSREVAEAVVDSLHLMVSLLEPRLPRDQVLRVIDVPRDAPAGVLTLTRNEGGSYDVHMDDPPRGVRLPSRVEPGVPFHVGSATLALAPALTQRRFDKIEIGIYPFRETVSGVQSHLGVSRVDPRAKALAITYITTDRLLAAAVPNTVGRTYIARKLQLGRAQSQHTVDFLREQVGSYEHQLVSAENALRSFREQQRVVSPEAEAARQVERLAELQAERDRLRAERDALAQLLERVSQGERTRSGTSPYRQLASFPVFLSNRAVQDILQALTELENQRSVLLNRRTEENPDVQGLDRRIRELELQLYQMARNYQEGLESQIASADVALGRFGAQLEAIPAREVEYARLLRQQKLLDELYVLLQTRLKEAEIREAAELSDVRVIDSAIVPTRPISPRPLRNLFLGTLVGLMLGIAAAFSREALDTRVRTREDVQTATGHLPILGVIPRFPMLRDGGRLRRVPEGVERVVVRAQPNSPAAEAFRALRTSIVFSGVHGGPQVMVVTSAMPGDGKSTSSANLAVTMADQGTRTLLVDADLRRGTVHHLFQLPQEPGLTQVLLGMASLDQAVHSVGIGKSTLDVLTAGTFPPNPAELLGSEQMEKLLAELRSRYSVIIFDAPPLNLVTDATVLAKRSDGAVLVTRNGVTDKRALFHAAAQLQQVQAPVSGVILNDVNTSNDNYYGYGYAYGYTYGARDALAGRHTVSAGSNGKNGGRQPEGS